MNIDTVTFSHILENDEFSDLNHFLSHTAFVICHKNEPVETLLSVLWYLPANSPIIMVTNCPLGEFAAMKKSLAQGLMHHTRAYLVHQKDLALAQLLGDCGVQHILGEDERVVDGKGEGMYIGTLCAMLLGYPQWIVFFDADNLVPSALLEYTLAMGRLFRVPLKTTGPLALDEQMPDLYAKTLHNVRICWSSKPDMDRKSLQEKVLGRCTRVISPLINTLLADQFGIRNASIMVSNAGEQGMTMGTARTLRFSSAFSVETFQLLDFLANATHRHTISALLQQYQSKSPHFHEKKADTHIRKMIAESLGSFLHFEQFLVGKVRDQFQQIVQDFSLQVQYPRVYPALQDLPVLVDAAFLQRYHLFQAPLYAEEVLQPSSSSFSFS
jgi:mannosyl-3-phosphoglycerate synthase